MTTFVGAEYLIANAFIHLTESRYLTIKELNECQRKMQNYWNSNNIDAIINGNIKDAAYQFDDYFEIREDVSLILLKPNITKMDLEYRFVGYLPLEVILSFEKAMKNFS